MVSKKTHTVSKKLIGVIAVAVVVTLAGCATAATPTKSGASVTIGFAIPTSKATYFTAYIVEVKKRAEELGVQVNFAFAEDDANKQNTQVADFATAGASGIVVAPVDIDANVVGVQQLGTSGPPVITSNRFLMTQYGGTDGANPRVHTGFSDYTVGLNSGELIVQACADKNPCNVVLEVGTLGSAPQVERERGAREALAAASNVKILAVESNDFQAPKAIELTSQLLTRFPQIDVIATQDDATAVGALQSVNEAGRGAAIRVVGVGGSKDGIAAIVAGDLYGTVWVSPKAEGVIALEAILAIIDHEAPKDLATVEGRPTVAVPIANVTSDNAAKYPGEW